MLWVAVTAAGQTSLPASSLVDVYVYRAIHDFHGKGAQVDANRRIKRLAGAEIEAAGVPWAFDGRPLYETIRNMSIFVSVENLIQVQQ